MRSARLALLALALTVGLQAQMQDQHPNTARGFSPEKMYDFSGIDSVNMFNGNLTLRVPIGHALQVNGALGYALSLTYNSNCWEYYFEYGTDPVSGHPQTLMEAYPAKRSNAGMGWLFSLGRIIDINSTPNASTGIAGTYESPDGADHKLYGSLHGEPSDGVHVYTRDGSYIRAQSTGTLQWTIELADGTKQKFENLETAGNPWPVLPYSTNTTELRLTEISDRFGNTVSISYSNNSTYKEIWTIRGGGTGGTQVTTAYFQTPALAVGNVDSFAKVLLTRVETPRVGGGVVSYNFNYQYLSTPPGYGDDFTAGTISTTFLSSIVLPTNETYVFTYDRSTSTTTPAVPLTMKLPTGGTVDWVWGLSDFPIASWSKPSANNPVPLPSRVETRHFGGGTWSYGERTSENGELCSQSSTSSSYSCPNGTLCIHGTRQKTAWVTGPDQTTTIAYFSLYTQGSFQVSGTGPPPVPHTDLCAYSSDGWATAEYGMPFTRYCPDPSSGCGTKTIGGLTRYLSQETRTGFVEPTNWGGKGRMPLTSANEKALRSTWVTYQIDSNSEVKPILEQNARAIGTLTFFEDRNDAGGGSCNSVCYAGSGPADANAYYSGTNSYGFDGFGHFNQQSALSNVPATKLRTIFTKYESTLDGAGDWVLGAWSEQCSVDELSQRTSLLSGCGALSGVPVTNVLYDRARGVITARRTAYVDLSSGATDPSRDLLAIFDYDTADHGNLSQEKYYGGDRTALVTSTQFAPVGNPEYQLNHGYVFSSGSLTNVTSQYLGASFKSDDLDFDPYTGVTTAARDGAGLLATYEYDTYNRLTGIRPPGDAWTEFLYSIADVSIPASVIVVQRPNGTTSAAAALTDKRIYFDPWGRVAMAKTLMPGGWSTTVQTYDGLSRVLSQAMPEFLATPSYDTSYTPAHSTSFLYDALGRKSRVTQPDGKYVSFVYGSVRTIDRKAWLATGSFETEVTTTETYDGAGHLYSVTEGSGANNGNVTTYYGYDVGDRLITVATPAAEGTQTRTFIYDGRGFLQYEMHPELGVAGGGTTTYSEYDSRGHVGRKISGPTDGAFDLKYAYDPSERLTDVTEPDPASFTNPKARRSVVNLQYATSNNPFNCTTGTCDARNGKLLTATRHNYDALFGDVAVAETYTYRGRAGRVSSRGTTVSSTANFDGATFNYSQTWDDLGGLLALTYPQATGVSAPARTVTNGFTNGLLTSVGSYASSIAYQPNGVIATVTHGSGSTAVTDTWATDSSGMPRPASITTTNASNQTLWTSGTYTYDGAGNIKQIGTTSYVYDYAGRLRNVNDTSLANPSKTTYKFDTFGNYLSTSVNYCGTLANGVKRCASTSGTPLTLNGTTNHYVNITYDDAGNVRADGTHTYTFDARNMMTRLQTAQSDDHYLYSADDERLAIVSRIAGHNKTKWTLRNTANQLLRTFSDDATSGTRVFMWAEDAIWRGASQVARESTTSMYNHSVDHIGSLRAVTNSSGSLSSAVAYAPFGLGGVTGVGPLQFTGYERDTNATADALDYAHARYMNPGLGRFLSRDPVLQFKQTAADPQAWNRYQYVRNNPLRFVDPTGKYTCTGSNDQCDAVAKALDKLRQAADMLTAMRSPGASALNAAVGFYGKRNERNGVAVSVGDLHGLGNATTEKRESVVGTFIIVSLDVSNLMASSGTPSAGIQMAATMAHEAEHGVLIQRGEAPGKNWRNIYRDEREAFRWGGYVNAAFAEDSTYHVWERGAWNLPKLDEWAREAADEDCRIMRGCDK